MNDRYLLERRADARYYRFALGVGLVAATVLHAALVLSPGLRYRPVLEQTRLRRVVIARPRAAAAGGAGAPAPAAVPATPRPEPTQPRPLPPRPSEPSRTQPERNEGAAAARPAAETAARAPAAAADAAGTSSVAPSAGAAAPALPGGRQPAAAASVPRAAQQPPSAGTLGLENKGKGTGRDEWSALLADLAARGKTLTAKQLDEQRRAAGAAKNRSAGAGGDDASGRGGSGGRGSGRASGSGTDPDGFLDPRVRITVVSYPATSLDDRHPAIAYPDLRFHRRQLKAGICRVYVRVWTDGAGRVTRTQIKTPETEDAQQLYAPFVNAVTQAVAEWPFDRRAAEVHVDVLFEIE
ncbi:MAG: hypothetical protein HZB55_21565 [Deltaproteobacteria bacterium]|nr:hypothetical protein [Deltaproteobacteria bacterium]